MTGIHILKMMERAEDVFSGECVQLDRQAEELDYYLYVF